MLILEEKRKREGRPENKMVGGRRERGRKEGEKEGRREGGREASYSFSNMAEDVG